MSESFSRERFKPLQTEYPVNIDLRGQLVVIVGAGTVGRRKLAGLLHVDARVRLIDPVLKHNPFVDPAVEPLAREFRSGDLAGACLVFACTDSAQANARVVEEAQQNGILCCDAQTPENGNFSLPAQLRRGPLMVAVSTGGRSPGMAACLRDRLALQVPDSWGVAVELAAAVRRKWLTENLEEKYNQQVLRRFWQEELLPAVEAADSDTVDRLLQERFGAAFSLAQLQIQLPEGMS